LVLGVNVHYEILGRRSKSWTILEVIKDRAAATDKATTLWNSKQFNGVRILKESYDKETHAFSSVEIFSRGATGVKSKYDQTGTVTPCLTPDDLYSADGRRSIWELMQNTLSDWRITPTELLHSLEHYYKLYNTGTKLQDAVQRTAVSFENEEGSIQERMRKIYKVIEASVDIMKGTKDKVPSLEMGRLKPVIESLEKAPNKKFLLMCGLVEYLRPTVTLTDKFGRIAVFLANHHPDWVTEILDQLLADFLNHPPVLDQLLGDHESRDSFITQIAYLQAGKVTDLMEQDPSQSFNKDIIRLSGFLVEGSLPLTSYALFDRLKTEINAAKPINENGLIAQLTSLRALHEVLRNLDMDIHALDAIGEDLAARAGRLINSQSVSDLMEEYKNPIKKVNALLDLEAVTVGGINKRTVANFILPILSRPEYETVFMGLDSQPVQRMNDLVALQKKVKVTDLTEMHKRKIAEKLDEFCRTILDNTQILKKIHQLNISLQEKSEKILIMMADDFFTDGDCRNRAEQQVRLYMKQEGFTSGLIEGLARQAAEEKLIEFKTLLSQAGLKKVETDQQDTL